METSNSKSKSHINVVSFVKENEDNSGINSLNKKENEDSEPSDFKPVNMKKKGNSTNLTGFLTKDIKTHIDKMED